MIVPDHIDAWTNAGIEDPEDPCINSDCTRPRGHAGFCDNEENQR
jgi:hypothetical protein